ncbi:MAG: hypothetical protein K2H76_08880 [Muribaculaceae bacterium]|nr:hypothetical protein [Muribaculaceae bacterium]MDE6028291.1 hypothetical protein [Muribaculaceae bacterium]
MGETVKLFFSPVFQAIPTLIRLTNPFYGKTQQKAIDKFIPQLANRSYFRYLRSNIERYPIDDKGDTYPVIHTDSRNLGKQVADVYQAKAIKPLTAGAEELEATIKRIIEEYKAAGRREEFKAST